MNDDSEDAASETKPAKRPRVRMPVEDRIPPQQWQAEHPDDTPQPDGAATGADAERLRSTPWGYR